MSKKKLLEFGLKEADAFQKNFKIFFDRLVRGYKSVMNREPEGLDLLKIKMEAREKALNTTKVVNQKGLTLDPDKPIVGGTQEGIPTIKTKFDEELDEFNLSKDDPMGDFEKIVKGEGETGLPKKEAPQGVKDILEEELGVKLYGDETFDELMIIKNTGKHPRDMADGGRVGFSKGGPTDDNIIGKDLPTGLGGILGQPTTEDDDMSTKTAGLGVLTGLKGLLGTRLGEFVFQRGKKKALDMATKKAIETARKIEAERVAKEAARKAETQRIQARINRDPRGYDGSRGPSANPYGGGGGGLHSDYKADGGLITMFVEKR